jgi:hypothetical protein
MEPTEERTAIDDRQHRATDEFRTTGGDERGGRTGR